MDMEDAAVIQDARDTAQWAASQIPVVDTLIAAAQYRPLSPHEQGVELSVLRQLLVRMTQTHTLMEYTLAARRAPWWQQAWRRIRGRRPKK